MKAVTQCSWCILHDVVGALESLPASPGLKEKVVDASVRFLGKEFSLRKTPSYYITRVHRILKDITGISTPFREERRRCNDLGMRIAGQMERRAGTLEGRRRFKFLLRWAVAGNHLDFRTVGAGYGPTAGGTVRTLFSIAREWLVMDHTERIYDALRGAERILYIHDNVGEIALDRLLIGEILRMGPRMAVSALKGGLITGDATVEDGVRVGLDRVSTRIISSGPDTLGVSWEEMSAAMRKELKEADLIVSKGQANFYVLSEHRAEIGCPIVYLLRTKCSPVSFLFGSDRQGGVAALDRGRRVEMPTAAGRAGWVSRKGYSSGGPEPRGIRKSSRSRSGTPGAGGIA